MSTGLSMMLKSLGVDPKMIEKVAHAVERAAGDLKSVRVNQELVAKQNEEILVRLRALTPDVVYEFKEEVPQLAMVSSNGG